MGEILSNLVEPIKNIIPFIRRHFLAINFAFALLGWVVLLFPAPVFEFLRIGDLRTNYSEIIGAITFIATFFLIFGLIYKAFEYITDKRTYAKELKERKTKLEDLTSVQKGYLRKYVEGESQTVTFTGFDGVVQGLIKKGILYKPDSKPNQAGEQDYNMNDWYYLYLSKNRTLLSQKPNERTVN